MSRKLLFFCLASLILLSSARITLPPELQEYVDDLHGICIKKSGITEADHAAYDLSNKDQKMLCYMKCLMLESKWMNPDGVIQYDFILAGIHPDVKDILEAAINQCRVIEDGADLCEKSYNFNKCMNKADPEVKSVAIGSSYKILHC